MKKLFASIGQPAFCHLRGILLASAILFNGCKKEGTVITPANSVNERSDIAGDICRGATISRLTGWYNATGTRTLFIGAASDSAINLVIDLAPYSPKEMTSLDARSLVCDYADLGYGGPFQLGYQYIIRFYPRKNTFDVQPNEIMASLIVPGSWVVYEKSFNPIMRQFHFKTKYANASSGYDRIVDETLTWQSK